MHLSIHQDARGARMAAGDPRGPGSQCRGPAAVTEAFICLRPRDPPPPRRGFSRAQWAGELARGSRATPCRYPTRDPLWVRAPSGSFRRAAGGPVGFVSGGRHAGVVGFVRGPGPRRAPAGRSRDEQIGSFPLQRHVGFVRGPVPRPSGSFRGRTARAVGFVRGPRRRAVGFVRGEKERAHPGPGCRGCSPRCQGAGVRPVRPPNLLSPAGRPVVRTAGRRLVSLDGWPCRDPAAGSVAQAPAARTTGTAKRETL
jgi:hypothetical protein